MKKLKLSATHYGILQQDEQTGQIIPFANDQHALPMTQAAVERASAKNRILFPYVRKSYLKHGYQSDRSRRGQDKFVKVSWDTAVDLIANELNRVYQQHGRQAVFGGSYGWHTTGGLHNPPVLLGRMLNILGGYVNVTENYSTHAIAAITPFITGEDEAKAPLTHYPDLIEHSECIVFWGCNPLVTNLIGWLPSEHTSYDYFAQLKQAAQTRQLDFICIDPVYHETADYFNAQHVAIRPGSDVALMMGMVHYLYTNNLYDKAFIQSHTVGFERFIDDVLGFSADKTVKTPAWAAQQTGIAQEMIIALAKQFITQRTMLMAGWGMQRAIHGDQTHWMLIILAAMLGQIGLPGGGYGFSYHYSDNGAPKIDLAYYAAFTGISAESQITGEWQHRPIQTIPVSRIVDCLLNPNQTISHKCGQVTYPDLKLAYWAGGNPFHHHPDRNLMIQAWQKLDTFIVHDVFWTATAKMADIVLPATLDIEREDIVKTNNHRFMIAMKPLINKPPQAWDDYDIFAAILSRFSDEQYQAFTEGRTKMEWLKNFYDKTLQNANQKGIKMPDFATFWQQGWFEFVQPSVSNVIKHADFRQDPQLYRLNTPSGKIEIFSQQIAQLAYPDCPGHPIWFATNSVSDGYPLRLVTPHSPLRLHSQLNNTTLGQSADIAGREPVWIHPDDAARRRLKTGDIARVFNQRGQILAGVYVTERVASGVMSIRQGAWYTPDTSQLINRLCLHGDVNVLVSNQPVSEFSQANQASTTVQIEKYRGEISAADVFQLPDFTQI
ncbi:molybdopterin-dependent oxidoreductase [Utexia brackfieldae]|uniref:molybdopterin-dependent oxidoreductase n=1 Tax=Utexia brackfieldae TaxID=3074108 RepID=UPI00370D8776